MFFNLFVFLYHRFVRKLKISKPKEPIGPSLNPILIIGSGPRIPWALERGEREERQEREQKLKKLKNSAAKAGPVTNELPPIPTFFSKLLSKLY